MYMCARVCDGTVIRVGYMWACDNQVLAPVCFVIPEYNIHPSSIRHRGKLRKY